LTTGINALRRWQGASHTAVRKTLLGAKTGPADVSYFIGATELAEKTFGFEENGHNTSLCDDW